jgi:hypothetical protein
VYGQISTVLAIARRTLTWWASQERDTALIPQLTTSIQKLLVTVTTCVTILVAIFVLGLVAMGPDVRHDLIEFVHAFRGKPHA